MKRFSTDQTQENIEKIIDILEQTPSELVKLSKDLNSDQLHKPLAPGKRSFIEDVTHLINVEAIGSRSIFYPLMISDPILGKVHPEKDFGNLMKFDELEFEELLNYFTTRRKILLRVLKSLKPNDWSKTSAQEGRKNKDTIYRSARGLSIHEYEHLEKIKERLEN